MYHEAEKLLDLKTGFQSFGVPPPSLPTSSADQSLLWQFSSPDVQSEMCFSDAWARYSLSLHRSNPPSALHSRSFMGIAIIEQQQNKNVDQI